MRMFHTFHHKHLRCSRDNNMKVYLSIFVFGMLLAASLGHIGGQSSYQEVNPQVYCGRTLARALALLCYDDMGPEKRSDGAGGTMYNPILSPYYKNQESHNWPWMPSYKAMSMGSHRGKRLVVSECCDKPCSLNELLSYC